MALFEPCRSWRGFFIFDDGENVEVVLNGASRAVGEGSTVSSLLEELSLPATRVAVERNREIVRKSEYDATKLSAGDRLEIVTFVGGG